MQILEGIAGERHMNEVHKSEEGRGRLRKQLLWAIVDQ
jgi:hypothetical protein